MATKAKKAAGKSAKKTASEKTSSKKTASKKAPGRKPGRGTRYTDSAKQKVIAFVEKVNTAKGRGGVAAAARKFGVSPLSIGNWLNKGGASAPVAKRASGKSSGSGRDRVLSELTGLNREIAKKRRELESLESRFNALKSSL